MVTPNQILQESASPQCFCVQPFLIVDEIVLLLSKVIFSSVFALQNTVE